ncbi:hypothetical protein CC79DRAFT_1332416 [Sarocladium strictum]
MKLYLSSRHIIVKTHLLFICGFTPSIVRKKLSMFLLFMIPTPFQVANLGLAYCDP